MPDFLKVTAAVPRSFRFNDKPVRPGDVITSKSERITKTLLDLHYAERVEAPAESAQQHDAPSETITRDLSAETQKRKGAPRKGRYARRDMRAED